VVRIRPFQPDDTTDVIDLWRQCELVIRLNNPERDIQLKVSHDAQNLLVATIDDQLIGTVMAGYEGHRGWINYLAVAPLHRYQGIGRRLMNAAEEKLRAQGCPKINLQIRVHNQEAINFYKAIGFNVDAVIGMGKRLEENS
jgi:ribosomal protein S18 acetylase RimI-like enzyme